jgi:hypothetical protein
LIHLLLSVVYRYKYGSNWPLRPEVRNVLKTNSREIIKLLDTDDDLIGAVISKCSFGSEQLESVTGTTDERSTKLLDKIARSSIATYNRFLDCLRHMRPNVVPLLPGEGKDLLNNVCIMYNIM